MINLNKEQHSELLKQGYSEQQIQTALVDMEEDGLEGAYNESQYENDPRLHSQHSAFATTPDNDLAKWQLELNDILERTEHILRGDIPGWENGHMIWNKNPHPEQNPLNDEGVQEILKMLSMYINRNTILSDYDNDEINFKVFDFGRRLNNYIFMRYDEIGMDTEQKRKSYETITGEMVDIVHSAYKRALHGGERRSIREMINVNQNSQSYGPGMDPTGNRISERSFLNPMRMIKGKYV